MKCKFLQDTKLMFGNKIQAFDPRKGLLKGGPFGPPDSEQGVEYRVIKCGVIGTADSISSLNDYIKKISFGLGAIDKTYGNLGFPRLGPRSPLKFSLNLSDSWSAKILDREIKKIDDTFDKNEQKNELINLYDSKFEIINNVDPHPDLIFVLIPEEIIDIFQREGIVSSDIRFANRNEPDSVYESEGDIDFHSIIKIIGMKYYIPTQIIKPEFFLGYRRNKLPLEDEVTKAWNLCVALYYKAKQIPWKFSKLEENVCYVGISFYRDFSEKEVYMNTSMAQVFLYTGESFILRGDSFKWEKTLENRSPNLGLDVAKSLINKVIKLYYDQKGMYPNRIVIHKSSNFQKDEIEGFYQNDGNIKDIDMVTIIEYPDMRFYRNSNYPIMRGTLIISEQGDRHFLYTYGFIPPLNTYPGMRVPIPIEIRTFTKNSDIELICREILILTRLDWNNIKYCHRLPVTLAFSEKVGELLAEKRANDTVILKHYRYYM